MQSLFELVRSHDFLVNISAGLLIFLLDIVVIVGLVPYLLARAVDNRWQPARKALSIKLAKRTVQLASVYQQSLMDSLQLADLSARGTRQELKRYDADAIHRMFWEDYQAAVAALKSSQRDVADDVATYAVAFSPQMLNLVSDYVATYSAVVSLIEGSDADGAKRPGTMTSLINSINDKELSSQIEKLHVANRKIGELTHTVDKVEEILSVRIVTKSISDVIRGCAEFSSSQFRQGSAKSESWVDDVIKNAGQAVDLHFKSLLDRLDRITVERDAYRAASKSMTQANKDIH